MILILITSMFIHLVDGHGYISNPAAQFYGMFNKTTYNAITTADIDPIFKGLKWDDSPDNNLRTFTTAFAKSKFKSLKQLFDAAAVDCGNSRIDVPAVNVEYMNTMSWQNDEYKQGFIPSHSGPCEAWLDNVQVAQSADCRTTYPGYPAVIPIDYSTCKDQCVLHFYWIALHEPNWQLYKQCVPVSQMNDKLNGKANTCKCKCD